jgi:membrane protein YdbS with pleckstrin-like domain
MPIQVPPEIQRMLRKGERIVWYGRPNKTALTRTYLPFTAIGLIMVLSSFAMMMPMMAFNSMHDDNKVDDSGFDNSFMASFWSFFVAFIIIGIIIALLPFVAATMLANNLHYAITDQRLITLGGLFGPGMQSTDFDKVQSVDVVVGFFDRALGTGTVRAALAGMVYTGRGHYRGAAHALQAVEDPYEVQEELMEAMDNYSNKEPAKPAPPTPKGKKTKYCRYCDAKLPTDSKFCSECGKEQ